MRYISKSFILFLLVCMVGLQSCATLFTGTKDVITINSEPPGARVEFNGNMVGRTPYTGPVKRNTSAPIVTLKMDGYETRSFELGSKLNVISLLNVINLFGFIVDGVTGAIFVYDPKVYTIQLDKQRR